MLGKKFLFEYPSFPSYRQVLSNTFGRLDTLVLKLVYADLFDLQGSLLKFQKLYNHNYVYAVRKLSTKTDFSLVSLK